MDCTPHGVSKQLIFIHMYCICRLYIHVNCLSVCVFEYQLSVYIQIVVLSNYILLNCILVVCT